MYVAKYSILLYSDYCNVSAARPSADVIQSTEYNPRFCAKFYYDKYRGDGWFCRQMLQIYKLGIDFNPGLWILRPSIQCLSQGNGRATV